ncbi:ATP-dependent helicase [Williamsia serinedens]|uniref:ATP-dependent helicase Lhr and Lhr-like helicase n=1 Tax=Williamsia serinedens TaxID=391736 RepID=A0ABT1H3J3_9NOCA|nr:ATP-dependent helicase [Williamsia serinedens]MCP2160328.1 ATP-dependent helicase Lhr and Lhr-like helicase [Williamsia serinedens]
MSTATAEVLDRFSAPTRDWFTGAFTAPTAAQLGAWSSIADGANTLVVAPTGSGKTLSAFLWALDRLTREPREGHTTSVLYISPLKALAVDVERNLRAPLAGLQRSAAALGLPAPDITVGVRSGDTPSTQRRQLLRTPPDILITTPESLFLMLTSSARDTLRQVHTVIVDEVHAVAATKRGTHLALSLERLDALLDQPAQRIGLSATVRPPERVAQFLAGSAPCTVVNPPAEKTFDLTVDVPVPDMANIPPPPGVNDLDDEMTPTAGSLWPYVENGIVDLIEKNRSTIVFANSRRLAERLTARLNEIHAERSGVDLDAQGNDAVPGGAPAYVMGSGASQGAPPVLARAHHGSVSKEQRALIEDDLKAGRLRCVVATSSLELGIDMGAVDLVVQVETPPSVAGGLQRIGRAGHQVGEISRGVVFPKHRADLVHATVAVRRMRDGLIEEIAVPANPLDILAQHTVAASAVDVLDVQDWYETVRRAAPYATLSWSVYEATLDLLSGRYPSDEFAELRPRVVWDRDANTITGRPGAQRLAVTSGGSIPDRGMFGVFMVGEKATRVGELDEEMVYESRVGDVFALGASSWRIEDITHDRVLVSPAAGVPGRLPFWIGDAVGRPSELGRAIGAFIGEVGDAITRGDTGTLAASTEHLGLTAFARDNLVSLISEQREATGHLPTDRTLVLERFRDELGDWRLVLHSPYGLRVHAPWASAIGARLRDRVGVDGAVTASDDGIIIRLPDTDDEPPGASIVALDPDEIEDLVTDELGGSALFASRFRECAARALLLPRRNPGRRAPLWQQRQRSAQLLQVAARYPQFPIILETLRECLQDVYDLPALIDLLRSVSGRRVRIVEVATETPSPFAASLLFGYVGAFMYEDDAPLAERRAAALSLDTALLAQLLGRIDLRELLDPAVIADVEARLQRTHPDRRAHDAEGITDLLRWLGPLTDAEIADRFDTRDDDVDAADAIRPLLENLHVTGRIISVNHGGRVLWAGVEDTSRLRDALGIPAPQGVPAAFTEPVEDPVGDLVGRFARTHGPFTASQVTDALGLAPAVVRDTLARLAAQRRVVEGDFRADLPGGTAGDTRQWCNTEVLSQIRRASLAASRAEIAPVPTDAFARFLLDWQHVTGTDRTRLRGVDGLATVIDQLAGVPLPASAWETLVLPSRVVDYRPAMLDELVASGEVVWSGHGALGSSDGWIALHPADLAPLTVGEPGALDATAVHEEILDRLAAGGAYQFRQLLAPRTEETAAPAPTDEDLERALWDLVWTGRVGNDSFAPVRALLGRRSSGPRGTPAHRQRSRPPRLRAHRLTTRSLAANPAVTRAAPPTVTGRWFAFDARVTDPTVETHGLCEQLLERYGVVTKGAVMTEEILGGFARIYRGLSGFEDTGRVRRGYFVDGLGGAQFAAVSTVDALREHAGDVTDDRTGGPGQAAGGEEPQGVVVASCDPANPYGATLPWPETEGHRPGRKPGALVVLVDGRLALFVERGGKTVLTFSTDDLPAAATALAETVRAGRVDRVQIERVDGENVLGTPVATVFTEAGFTATPRGIRLRHMAR